MRTKHGVYNAAFLLMICAPFFEAVSLTVVHGAGLKVLTQTLDKDFPQGYDVYSDAGELLKTVPGPTSATVRAKTSGKTFAAGEAYLSDWSYGRLREGKPPNWIVEGSTRIKDGNSDHRPSKANDGSEVPTIKMDLPVSSDHSTRLTSSKRNEVAPVAQMKPFGRLMSVSLSSSGRVFAVANEYSVFLYETDTGRLIKAVPFTSISKEKIKKVYFGASDDELFVCSGLPWNLDPRYDVGDCRTDITRYDWVKEQVRAQTASLAGEVIGYRASTESFAVCERGSDDVIVVSSAGEVRRRYSFKSQSPGWPPVAAAFLEDESLVVLRCPYNMTVAEYDSKVYRMFGSTSDELEWNEVCELLGMEVPNRVGANLLPEEALLLARHGSNKEHEWFFLSPNSRLQVTDVPSVSFSLSAQGKMEKRSVQAGAVLPSEGLAASADGSVVFAWPINQQGVGSIAGSFYEEFIRPVGPTWLLDVGAWSVDYLEGDREVVTNAAISDDGRDLVVVSTSCIDQMDWHIPPRDSSSSRYLINLRNLMAGQSEATDTAGPDSISGNVMEDRVIDPRLALIQTQIQFSDQRYLSGYSYWTIRRRNGSPEITQNDSVKGAPRRGGWSRFVGPYSERLKFSRDDTLLSVGSNWENASLQERPFALVSVNTGSGRALSRVVMPDRLKSIYPISEENMVTIGSRDIHVVNYLTGKVVSALSLPSRSFRDDDLQYPGKVAYAHKRQQLYVLGDDGCIYVIDLDEELHLRPKARIFPLPGRNPTVVLQNNYFCSDTGGAKGVHFSDGRRTFPLEQFDLRLNRPDIVMEQFGAPAEAVAIARQLREKRLKRMGVTEEMLKPDFHVPDVEIAGDIPATTDAGKINLVIKASDTKYTLERLKVYVNNVPVNGRDGELLREERNTDSGLLGRIAGAFTGAPAGPQSLERTVPIKLAAGRNKIQVSVMNNAGAESLYANAEVNCTAKRPKPTLYAVAMGVSEYSHPDWNLKYAAKDARDVLTRLKDKAGDQYGEVKELLLTDSDVTKENFATVREFLKDATIDDTVLMFAAGHGLLDSKYDYYFGTSDIDFNKPADNGIAFEQFDDLLAALPSLKKSLLIDTCHAGELDEEEKTLLASAGGVSAALPTANGVAVRSIGTRGMNVKAVEGARGASEWYDRLQGLFVDLRRGSGSTILSSSAGAEYALESSEQQNGLFTYAVLEALDGKPDADTNKDGSVQMSELGEYVKKRVSELTNNKQTPNTRRVNLEGDFTLVKTK